MAALLGMMVLLLAGCGKGREDGRTVTFWAMGREGETVRQLLPEFYREHPDIRVEVQTLPWTGAHQKLLTAVAGGVTPDLCQLGNTWIAELAALNVLLPVGPLAAASPVVHEQDYFAGIWDTNRIDGTLYGVPWYVDTRLLFYRRDLLAQAGFDHPPADWQEWARQMAAIKAMVGPRRYAMLLPLNEFEQLESLGLQQPQPMLRDGGRYGNFDNPGFQKALQFYLEMFRKGWAPLASNTEISNVWTEFARGYYSFYVSGPWNITEFKSRMPAELADAWATAPLPGPNGPGASLAGGSSLVIFKNSPNQAAAWELVEYLSRPDVQRRFFEIVGDMPPRRASWEGAPLAGDPYARAFREQLERARPAPQVPEWEQIMTQLNLVGEELAHGRLTVAEAARELDRRADHILAKRRWMLARAGRSPAGSAEAAR